MAYPDLYAVTYSYTGFQLSQGDNSFPGTQLDSDLAGLESSIMGLAAFTERALRSDGALTNGIVTYDSLSAGLQIAGLAPADAWAAATFYVSGKSVVTNNNLYRAAVSHTSGVFATDLSAGKWTFVTAIPVGAAGAPGLSYGGTSTSSLLIAVASKTFTTQAGLAYNSGSRVRAASAANNANFVEGVITSYVGTTLVLNVDRVGGAGTFADWALSIVGDPGPSVAAGVNSLNGEIGAVAAASADKRYYASTSGNAGKSGLGPESAKLTLQAAINAANPGGVVFAGAGIFTQVSPLLMQPGVKVFGFPGTIITQGNSANLATLIDFGTNSAHGAGLAGVTIDGNRANNTFCNLVQGGAANDIVIEYCKIINSPENGILLGTGARPIISKNYFSNIRLLAGQIDTGASGIFNYAKIVDNHFQAPLGFHAWAFIRSNGNVFSRNTVEGSQIGATAAPMRVSTTAMTVNWVSGPNFANVEAGMFVVMNGGGEFNIATKVSNTQLTLSSSPGTTTNVPAIIGTGDLVTMGDAAFNEISDNYLSGGVTGQIMISNAYNAQDTMGNIVKGNRLFLAGQCAIGVFKIGISEVVHNLIEGNTIMNCAQSGAAGPGTGFMCGIVVDSGSRNTTINGNSVYDNQAVKTIPNWLGVGSGGVVIVERNTSIGLANGQAVFQGLGAVTFGAGWGSAASVTSAVSYGDSWVIVINAGGTGLAAYATVSVVTNATSGRPVGRAKLIYGPTGAEQGVFGDSAMGVSTKSFTAFPGVVPAAGSYTLFLS